MFQYQTSFAFYVHDMYYFTAQILKTCGVKISDIKVNFKATVLLS